MKRLTASQLRSEFLRFFSERGHAVVPSSPTIPKDDPTLLFANAGMNQFKDYFLGRAKAPYPRAASAQKCMRAGGKHNDLEEVGFSPWHHTMFEMLGNFSFGDYFKDRAIELAWEFVVGVLEIPPERLWATVYEGDDEAHELWSKYLPVARIARLGEEDNFWAMGETGPCGPCTEIHLDTGSGPSEGPGVDTGRFTELWNLVFMQFDRASDGALSPLPSPCVDTGMGLERTCALLQGVQSTYDIDLFEPIKRAIGGIANAKYEEAVASYRVICDHVRALAFTIADGATPSNEGRGYVVRRILRRAARHGRLLGLHEPFLSRLVPALVLAMGEAYPEIVAQKDHVAHVLTDEEERFGRTLDAGLDVFEKVAAGLGAGAMFPGDAAFKLYDTFGFPLDLTQVMARERGIAVDVGGFEKAMEKQRERSRATSRFAADEGWGGFEGEIPETPTEFVGYDSFDCEATLLAFRVKLPQVELVFDRTSFYAEGGGQVGDTGVAVRGNSGVNVTSTYRRGVVVVHVANLLTEDEPTAFRDTAGTRWVLEVDKGKRLQTMRHHTATHLLHRALHKVIGPHATQAGSLVDPDRLRFDFQCDRALTDEELRNIEEEMYARVLDDLPVTWREVSIDEAKRFGAMALFGEKYSDVVRMVQIGDDEDVYSRELCGGTHVSRTGQIGLVRIVSESAIAAGVRRIEAVAGTEARDHLTEQVEFLKAAATELKSSVEEVPLRIATLNDALKAERRKVRELTEALARGGSGLSEERVGDALVVSGKVAASDRDALRSYADGLRQKLAPGVAIIGAEIDGKAAFLAVVSDDLVKRSVKAGEIVKVAAGVAGGKGGGKSTLAEAGGKDPSLIDRAIAAAVERVRVLVGGER